MQLQSAYILPNTPSLLSPPQQTDDDDEKDKQRSPLLQIAEWQVCLASSVVFVAGLVLTSWLCWQYRLRLPESVFPAASKEQVKANLFQEIKKNSMLPLPHACTPTHSVLIALLVLMRRHGSILQVAVRLIGTPHGQRTAR